MRKLFFILFFYFYPLFYINSKIIYILCNILIFYLLYRENKYAAEHYEYHYTKQEQDEFEELLYDLEHNEELSEEEKKNMEDFWLFKKNN